jgi:hypothetical protein
MKIYEDGDWKLIHHGGDKWVIYPATPIVMADGWHHWSRSRLQMRVVLLKLGVI